MKQTGLGKEFLLDITILFYEDISWRPAQKLSQKLERTKGLKINWLERVKKSGCGENFNYIYDEATRAIEAEYFLLLNPDTFLAPDCIRKLVERANSPDRPFLIEAEQFPHRNPYRNIDEVTKEVDWCCGACTLVKSSFFEAEKGFDENIFLYGEDVELSWRAWVSGGSCVYVPGALYGHMVDSLFDVSYFRRYSILSQERRLLESHLVLVYKYLALRPIMRLRAMRSFWRYADIDRTVKKAAVKKIREQRHNIRRIWRRNSHIKIRGVGLYES